MIALKDYLRGLSNYSVIEPPRVLADVQARIRAIADAPGRKDAAVVLDQVRARLKCLDLKDCGWPPQTGGSSQAADLLHADSQKLVSAVLRVDHMERKVTILKYVLKVKP